MIAKTAEAKGNWARVLPMALYILRCTPSASTEVSPFLLTHGWEPRTPLQVLYQSWVQSDLGGVDLSEWIVENTDRLECARDIATSNQVESSAKKAAKWNLKAVEREFQVGDLVWIRKPGLDLKLRESWDGPGRVIGINSPLSYKIEMDKRVITTVHIQQLKEFNQNKAIKRVTAVLEQDTEGEEIINRYAEAKVEHQQNRRTTESVSGSTGQTQPYTDKRPWVDHLDLL